MGDTSRRGRPSPVRRIAMEGASVVPRGFEHLREHSIGLPQVLFQSITHMAPAAAVAYSLFISVPDAQQALPLSVGLALIACICAATAIGQLAKLFPSAGGMYTYAGSSLGPWAGFLVAFLFIGFQPLVAPFLYLELRWAMRRGIRAAPSLAPSSARRSRSDSSTSSARTRGSSEPGSTTSSTRRR